MNLDTGPQVEAECYDAIRATHSGTGLGQVLEILTRAGQGNLAEPGNKLPADLAS